MAFEWPPRTTYPVKEKISQVLWVLKIEGDIEDKGCAVRVLMDRLKAHGVEISTEHGFRVMLSEMEGGRYGDLIVRRINGRRTQAISLYTTELPPNYLPDVDLEFELDVDGDAADATLPSPENTGETFTRQSLFASEPPVSKSAPVVAGPAPVPATVQVVPVSAPVPLPAAVTAPVATVDSQFDRIAAELESELEELRRPMPTYVRPTVRERVGQDRNLDDKAGVINAILELVGNLAVMVAGEPTTQEADVAIKDRLADAIERAERYRRRAVDVEETAVARKAEADGLRRQVADRDAMIARMEANIAALQNGERVPDEGMVRTAQKFISEKPHDRRGESKLVYSTGG